MRPDYKKNKDNYDKSLDTSRKKKGCYGPGLSKYQFDNMKFTICPGNFYSQAVTSYIDLYYNYQRGVLPYEGTLMDQPSKIIDVFNTIDALIKNKQIEAHKEQEKKIKKSKAENRGRR